MIHYYMYMIALIYNDNIPKYASYLQVIREVIDKQSDLLQIVMAESHHNQWFTQYEHYIQIYYIMHCVTGSVCSLVYILMY